MEFNLSRLSAELRVCAEEVFKELGLVDSDDGAKVEAERGDALKVERRGDGYAITYDKLASFARAFTLIKASGGASDFAVEEKSELSELGVMLDCSRNAVRTVEFVKGYIRKLAALGYDQFQLYTEDTYEIEGEPYFGYMRGRYTVDELREINDYGKKLGVELVPCIQTLAHLNQIFRWKKYHEMRDIEDVLLVDDERTYALIERMIATMRKAFDSDKIHIGMDEAYFVGRGFYADEHGATEDRKKILVRHLCRVCEICDKYGFKPMMWSDMIFRLVFGKYYPDEGAVMNVDGLENIPKNLRLAYWSYGQFDEKKYDGMIKMHREIGNELVFAGGTQTWWGFTPYNAEAFRATSAAVDACKKNAVDKVFFTVWGDNGAECSPLAVLPTLCMAGERLRGNDDYKPIFKALTGIEADEFLRLAETNYSKGESDYNFNNPSKYMLYNDPIGGLFDNLPSGDEPARYAALARDLEKIADGAGKYAYVFRTQKSLAETLEIKFGLGARTRALYARGDRDGVRELVARDYPVLKERLKRFYADFLAQWDAESKPFGFEIQDYRLGGLMQRIEHCEAILTDYANGKIDKIPQLDETLIGMTDEGFNSFQEMISASRM